MYSWSDRVTGESLASILLLRLLVSKAESQLRGGWYSVLSVGKQQFNFWVNRKRILPEISLSLPCLFMLFKCLKEKCLNSEIRF